MLEEQIMTQELHAFDKKIDSWVSLASTKLELEPVASRGATASPPFMPPAIVAFEASVF